VEIQKPAVPNLELVKMEELVCSQQCPPSITMSSTFTKFEQQKLKNNNEKKTENKEMNNLEP
jgi:hypothetical protein